MVSTSNPTAKNTAVSDAPLFWIGLLFTVVYDYLPLPWLRILDERALLLMKLAKNAQNRTLVDHATAFSPPTGVTRPFSSRPDVGKTAEAVGLNLDEVLLARHAPAGVRPGGNRHGIAIGTWQRRSRLNSNGHAGGEMTDLMKYWRIGDLRRQGNSDKEKHDLWPTLEPPE